MKMLIFFKKQTQTQKFNNKALSHIRNKIIVKEQLRAALTRLNRKSSLKSRTNIKGIETPN
jgi:hypothetical protein